MSDKELLERAIDRLEDLVAASTPGVWLRGHSSIGSQFTSGTEFVATLVVLDEGLTDGNADLIVALHRTIPALLDLMRCIVEFSEHVGLGEPGERPTQIQSVIDMARAILGESE